MEKKEIAKPWTVDHAIALGNGKFVKPWAVERTRNKEVYLLNTQITLIQR